jgi:glycosyltransferase involved in cell wall biosynthesis
LHIVHIGPSSVPLLHTRGGAIERRILELASAQAARGHRVTVYSAEQQTAVTLFRGMEVKAVGCARSGIPRRFEFLLKALRDISAEADVLHFHSIPLGAFFSPHRRAMKVLSYDYFAWRGTGNSVVHCAYRHVLRQFDWLLPVSEFCRRESQNYWRLPPSTIRVFHNGVNLAQFYPDVESGRDMRSRLGVDQAPVILYVGRVCRQKGTDVLIEAYQRVQLELPQTRLLVAGPPDHFGHTGRNALAQQVQDCGGVYLGAIEEGELKALYNACTVFVMPTREDEMFGMAALEAQACGKPVVCSRLGGLVEVISGGRFFPAGDPAALAAELLALLHSPAECARLASAARQSAERFAWPRLAEESEQIYCCSPPKVSHAVLELSR